MYEIFEELKERDIPFIPSIWFKCEKRCKEKGLSNEMSLYLRHLSLEGFKAYRYNDTLEFIKVDWGD